LNLDWGYRLNRLLDGESGAALVRRRTGTRRDALLLRFIGTVMMRLTGAASMLSG
jgi:hypothetical protein